jgi:hypothetical protein
VWIRRLDRVDGEVPRGAEMKVAIAADHAGFALKERRWRWSSPTRSSRPGSTAHRATRGGWRRSAP